MGFRQTEYIPKYRMELVTAVRGCSGITSEMFLSVSFLFSSSFLSIPTIPTALTLPGWKKKTKKTKPSIS